MNKRKLLYANLGLAALLGWGQLNKIGSRNETIDARTPVDVFVDSESMLGSRDRPDILMMTRDGTPYLFSGSTGKYKLLEPVGEGDVDYLRRRIDNLKNKPEGGN